jgi:integrase
VIFSSFPQCIISAIKEENFMASIVSRSNGTYLVRVSCGVDSNGKQIARSKTFKPSKPNLPYTKLNKELEAFVAAFEQEVADILKALESEPWHIRTMIEVALFTGCRRGEIVGLKWADIDFENQRISVKRSIYKLSDGKAREKEPKSKTKYTNHLHSGTALQNAHGVPSATESAYRISRR